MDQALLSKLNKKLEALPNSSVPELEFIIDHLSNNFKDNDWYTNTSVKSKNSIEKGLADLENNRTISHAVAMEMIKARINK
jgi:hypothetical protein